MSKHPPERPCIIAMDRREPSIEAGDHPDAVFRPCVFPPGIPRDTPYADRPRTVLPVERVTLGTGDYSLPGLEHLVALERKSGPDLLHTLFGEWEDSNGEMHPNLDRFRAELERAQDFAYFKIVCEVDERWLFAEARRRFETYGKSFDPFSVLALLRGFDVDLGAPTIWTGSKGLAEIEVGSTLARVWSQATGGKDARKARERGYAPPWLGVLEGQVPAVEEPPAAPAPRRKPASRFTASGELIPRGGS
ncbi:MAG TPA: hypothetical protein VFS09_06510 [Candidatus Eisenbacteria bacterium]|nr:hypothetical protein [Candidatus Eisenbacteria bacterium]